MSRRSVSVETPKIAAASRMVRTQSGSLDNWNADPVLALSPSEECTRMSMHRTAGALHSESWNRFQGSLG